MKRIDESIDRDHDKDYFCEPLFHPHNDMKIFRIKKSRIGRKNILAQSVMHSKSYLRKNIRYKNAWRMKIS